MARFEVFIPAADPSGFNVTLRVDADNWMAALKTGMQKLGEQGASIQNILVDIQDDNSVHVTESTSGRVFRLRELTDAEVAQAQAKRPVQAAAPAPAHASAAARISPSLVPAPMVADPGDGAKTMPGVPYPKPPAPEWQPDAAKTFVEPRPLQSRPALAPDDAGPETLPMRPSLAAPATLQAPLARERNAAAPAPAHAPSHARRRGRVEADAVVELEAPTRPVVGPIGRARRKNQKEEIEDLLAEVFERVQEVYAQKDTDAALYFLLDLALEKIPAESGTVFHADAATGDLTFQAVRGPRAREILDARMVIPAGTGVVGFCAVEGVSLALSDIQRDPRYYSVVAQKVKYTPTSVLCAPMMTHGRAFGALQILNRKGGDLFNEVEVGLASYVAHQAALYLNNR